MTTENPTGPAGTMPSAQTGGAPTDTGQRLKQDADAALETAKRDLDRVRTEAEQGARELLDEAQRQFKKATEKAKGMATEQKANLAGQLDSLAAAVAKAADELESDQHPTASYARSVADGVRRFSQSIRERDLDDFVAMGEEFGRRQPAAFMGIAAIAGFAASRFLLASAKRRERRSYVDDMDYGSSASTYPDGGSQTRTTSDTMGGTI